MDIWVRESNEPISIGLTGIDDIKQCVRILLSTVKESVHMDRSLGINADIIDTPTTDISLKNKEIFEALEKNEPRIKVKEIKHVVDNIEGVVKTNVLIEINESYLRG